MSADRAYCYYPIDQDLNVWSMPSLGSYLAYYSSWVSCGFAQPNCQANWQHWCSPGTCACCSSTALNGAGWESCFASLPLVCCSHWLFEEARSDSQRCETLLTAALCRLITFLWHWGQPEGSLGVVCRVFREIIVYARIASQYWLFLDYFLSESAVGCHWSHQEWLQPSALTPQYYSIFSYYAWRNHYCSWPSLSFWLRVPAREWHFTTSSRSSQSLIVITTTGVPWFVNCAGKSYPARSA